MTFVVHRLLRSVLQVTLPALCTLPALALGSMGGTPEEGFQYIRLGGFGTLAGTRVQNSGSVEFRSNNRMPSGTSSQDGWEFDNDSAFGVQTTLTPFRSAPEWSMVGQALMRRNKDNSFYPQTDWFYLAYKAAPDVTLRAGRFIAPVYMASDYRNVGYANPWLRMPVEVYSMATINNIDGVDALIKGAVGNFSYTLQPYLGHFDLKQPGATIFRFHQMAGINAVVEQGPFSFRMGYMAARHSVIRKPTYNSRADYSSTENSAEYRGQQACSSSAGFGSSCPYTNTVSEVYPEYSGLAAYYDRNSRPFDIAGIGFVYDDKLFAQGELVYKRAASASPNAIGWYLTLGWRVGDAMPYLSYAQHREIARFDTLKPAAEFPDAAVQTLGSSSDNKQRTLSAGVRYDLYRNVAFKLQYDRITPQRGSLNGGGSGRGLGWVGAPANFYQTQHLSVLAASIDFVF